MGPQEQLGPGLGLGPGPGPARTRRTERRCAAEEQQQENEPDHLLRVLTAPVRSLRGGWGGGSVRIG